MLGCKQFELVLLFLYLHMAALAISTTFRFLLALTTAMLELDRDVMDCLSSCCVYNSMSREPVHTCPPSRSPQDPPPVFHPSLPLTSSFKHFHVNHPYFLTFPIKCNNNRNHLNCIHLLHGGTSQTQSLLHYYFRASRCQEVILGFPVCLNVRCMGTAVGVVRRPGAGCWKITLIFKSQC